MGRKKTAVKRVINQKNFNVDIRRTMGGYAPMNIIGDLTDDADVWVLSVWCGSGYGMSLFAVSADDNEEAREKFYDYCKAEGLNDYISDFNPDVYKTIPRPDDSVYEFIGKWMETHSVHTQWIQFSYVPLVDVVDYEYGESYGIDKEKVYKFIDLVEQDDDLRFKVADEMEKIMDYYNDAQESEEYFHEQWISVTGNNDYIRGEDYSEQKMTLDEFITQCGKEAI